MSTQASIVLSYSHRAGSCIASGEHRHPANWSDLDSNFVQHVHSNKQEQNPEIRIEGVVLEKLSRGNRVVLEAVARQETNRLGRIPAQDDAAGERPLVAQ